MHSVAVSLPAAFFATLGLGFFLSAWQRHAERSLIGRSISGGMPMDGKKTAAVGAIRPLASPLTAPISSSPCVAYNYEIAHTGFDAGDRVIDFHGFSITPFVIQTVAGPVRLFTYPEFDFRESEYRDEESFQRARKYIHEANFTPMGMGPAAIGKGFLEIKDMLTHEDGCIKKDWAKVPKDYDIRKDYLVEQCLKIGENVCAFGIYSAERGGLIPDKRNPVAFPVRLMKGDGSTLSRTLIRRIIGSIIGAAILLAVAVAIIEGFFRFLPDFM